MSLPSQANAATSASQQPELLSNSEDGCQSVMGVPATKQAGGHPGTTASKPSHPQLSPALQDAILQRIAAGASPVAAAQAAGVPSRTWQHWMAIAEGRVTHHPDGTVVSERLQSFLAPLAERIARTVADTEARMAENMLQAGFTVGKNGVPEWRAHLELLKHSEQWRERWYERRELRVQQEGTLSVEHRLVQQLPMDDVLELAGPEFRDLL